MEKRKTTTRDMTQGNIVKQVLLFALPLMLGNVFQMLYNTVDSVVVGQFVSTQALAAVGSTTMIVNMLVFFFNGFSIGASVVIGIHFGAKNMEKLHKAVETTIAATFVMCVAFTVIGYVGVVPMLRLMSTPEDVFPEATEYLHRWSWCNLIKHIDSTFSRCWCCLIWLFRWSWCIWSSHC